jgi:hypothetical protein
MKNEVNVIYSDLGCSEENHETFSQGRLLLLQNWYPETPECEDRVLFAGLDVVDSYTSRSFCKYFRVLHVNIIVWSMIF